MPSQELSDQSSKRIFPSEYEQKNPTVIRLSLVDASTADFSHSTAIWYYRAPETTSSSLITAELLQNALARTLQAYPQFCGVLRFAPWNEQAPGNSNRYGRLEVCFNNKNDAGVEFVNKSVSATLASIIPQPSIRATREKAWDRTLLKSSDFLPETVLAKVLEFKSTEGMPVMAVQLTWLSCGGYAIGVKISHPLADAHTLIRFARDWSAVSRSMLNNEPLPHFDRPFNPQKVDQAALGNIDAADASHELMDRAFDLPFLRYDWWAAEPAYPAAPANIPIELLNKPGIDKAAPSSKPIPWSTWDLSIPVTHTILHFTHDQVQNLLDTACFTWSTVSRHDALVAHLWSCINRARNLCIKTMEPVHLTCAFGLRSRGRLDLGKDFMGSPLLNAAITMTGAQVAAPTNLDWIAKMIRTTVSKLDKAAIGAYLHALAFEATPQRIWQCFLGIRHVLVTSWVHDGLYEVDFDGRGQAIYVDAGMPPCDGLVQIQEAPPTGSETRGWTQYGAEVSVQLQTDVMERLLKDEYLFP